MAQKVLPIEFPYWEGMGYLHVEQSVGEASEEALEGGAGQRPILSFLADPDWQSATTSFPKNLKIIRIKILSLENCREAVLPENFRDPDTGQTMKSPKGFSTFTVQYCVGISLQQRFVPSDPLPESLVRISLQRDIRGIKDMEGPGSQ
jgi:hypothetical protein